MDATPARDADSGIAHGGQRAFFKASSNSGGSPNERRIFVGAARHGKAARRCPVLHQRCFPSITVTGQSAASKSSSSRALTQMRRVWPSHCPSGWKAGLSA